jgi:hypothetical protein
MIEARVLAIEPHSEQATTNPGTWAVQFWICHNGTERTFWRWHHVRALNANGAYVRPSNTPPTQEKILAEFWDDTFKGMHGFDFERRETRHG